MRSPEGEDRGQRVALFGVDAFTDRPFGGNPAMVCLLPEPASDQWMRRAAAELNQPATAFLHGRQLRWFTPAVELPLCGHGTRLSAVQASPRGGRLDVVVEDHRVCVGGHAITITQGEWLSERE